MCHLLVALACLTPLPALAQDGGEDVGNPDVTVPSRKPAADTIGPEGEMLDGEITLDPSLGNRPAAPIDRIVAVIGDRLVTTSDQMLEAVLAEHDPSPLPVVRERQADPLAWLIDAAVVRGLAGDVSIYLPTAVNVRERAERLRISFGPPEAYEAFLRAFGLDQDALEGILFTRLVVERYIARNLDLRDDSDAEGSPTTRYAVWIGERRSAVSIRLVEPSGLR